MNEVQNIFYQGNKKGFVPANNDTIRLEAFFRCAAVLMTDNLQLLGLNSMRDFTTMVCSPPVCQRYFNAIFFLRSKHT